MSLTMKLILVLAVCALAAVAYAEEELLYSDKYDYVDVDAILKNSRLRNQYYTCVMDTAPCLSPDAKFLKEKLPEALVTKCRKCTEKQKYMFEAIVTYFTEKEPEKFQAIVTHAIESYSKKKI